jgi:hypothetical protein
MSIDEYALKNAGDEIDEPVGASPAEAQPQQRSFEIPEFLKAKTGSGSVEDYIDHPMNLKKNEHFARVLRGLTGMFNSLDYAIIDVVIGALGYLKKPKIEA